MEAGEYERTRGTCLLACRLELDAVAVLLWISWCVLGGAIFPCFFHFNRFFFLRTHTACCKYEAALLHLPPYYLIVMKQGRGSEATEAVFCL